MASPAAKTSWTSIAAASLFFAALWTPMAAMFFGGGEFRSGDENRNLAAAPAMPGLRTNWFDFARASTAYFHDHFGFAAR